MSREALGDRPQSSFQATLLLNATGWMAERARNHWCNAWVNIRYNSTNQYGQGLDFTITFNEGRDLNQTHCVVPIVLLGVS